MQKRTNLVRFDRAARVALVWRVAGGDLESQCAVAIRVELAEALNDLRVEIGENPISLPIEKKMRQIGFLS